MVRGNAQDRARTDARRSAAKRTEPSTWKLFFLMDDAEFEADFVVARTVVGAKRAFSQMYGGKVRSTADLVTEIKNPPPWLRTSTWLGPDDDVLEEFGGKRLPSVDFPRWQFGSRVWGYPKTAAERYRLPTLTPGEP
jgi:hypothetical protein